MIDFYYSDSATNENRRGSYPTLSRSGWVVKGIEMNTAKNIEAKVAFKATKTFW